MRLRFGWAGVACAVWGLACVADGQQNATPRIVLSQEAWDFGTVWQEARPAFTLTVRNDGGAELQLTDVKSTCGCTVVEPGRNALPPGQATEIRVTYDTQGKQGHVESKVIITSNDPARPKVEFNIKGFVKRAVTATPQGGLVIRTLDTKPGQTGKVRLENQMEEPMRVQLKRSSVPQVDLEVKEITPGSVYEVIGRTNREMRPGITRGTIQLSTGLSREPMLTVHVQVLVLSRVDPVPPVILVTKDMQAPGQRVVSLQYYGTSNFHVTGAACKHPGVTVSLDPPQPPGPLAALSPAPTALVQARVNIPPFSQIPPEGAVVAFTTDDPGCPHVEVLVTTDKAAYELKMYGPPAGEEKPIP